MVNRKGIRCGAQGCRYFSGLWRAKEKLASDLRRTAFRKDRDAVLVFSSDERRYRVYWSGLCGRRSLSGGGILGENPVKCLVEAVKDANSFFTQGFTKHQKHPGKAKHQVTTYQDSPVRIG